MKQHIAVDVVDVTVRWGGTVIAVERLAEAQQLTIGSAAPGDRHFVCEHPSIPSARFPLLENCAGGLRVRTAEGMALLVDGAALEARDVTLNRAAHAVVRVGPLEIGVTGDRRAPTVLDRLRDVVDARLLRVSGVALALHAGVVMLLLLTRAPAPVDVLSSFAPRFTSTIAQVRPPDHAPAAAAPKPVVAALSNTPRVHPVHLAAKKQPKDTRAAVHDVLIALGLGAPATSTVFGAGPLSLGDGDIHGASFAANGPGLGSRDTGGGRGGIGYGIGSIDGHGPPGPGDVDGVALTGHRHKDIVVVPQHIIYDGGLSREEIQRVIGRVMSQIKFCYEKELNKDPALDGKVVTSWVITGTGDVDAAHVAQSTFGAPGGKAVADCVTHVIARQKFPQPKGGGQVLVTYPFVFSTSGS